MGLLLLPLCLFLLLLPVMGLLLLPLCLFLLLLGLQIRPTRRSVGDRGGFVECRICTDVNCEGLERLQGGFRSMTAALFKRIRRL
ncbi:hypothetical protein DFP72DRAFT_912099 [Ephemerocybe angulata]|uniref:Uncharacterized protein n=1 Tax=Ephemerocybe angulata TaxID=980116 RepID=A0A8H6HMV7_9AGAR|nr:hypothetical protein DFP72DRAFT_912099 [Tulosesus angulatus]